MNYKTELSRRNYRAGYVLVKSLVDGKDHDCEDFTMTHAETPTGDYIGDSQTAYRLCKKRGIRPEKITPSNSVCSVGWCEKKKVWFGWSHRSIAYFGVGSEVKRGNCAYSPSDADDFLSEMIQFWKADRWKESFRKEVKGEHKAKGIDSDAGVHISWAYTDDTPNEKMRGTISGCFHPYPSKYGRGEWTARDSDDARQMACDFAESVS
jgi:hypothetical protein